MLLHWAVTTRRADRSTIWWMAHGFEKTVELLFAIAVITVICGPDNHGRILVSAVGANQCGCIGNNNAENEATISESAVNRNIFYLDTANPAACNGTITSWKVCYYKLDFNHQFRTRYAVYRRSVDSDNATDKYVQVSSTVFIARRSRLLKS